MNDPENTTQATHTPGPWLVWPASNGVKITDSLGRHVAVIPMATPQWQADARLIAAAPELLAALEKFAWYDEAGMSEPRSLYDEARSAIAKAKEVK